MATVGMVMISEERSARPHRRSAPGPTESPVAERYADPRDQFVRREHPITMGALAECWHAEGRRDGHSRGALDRRRREERWDELRAEYWGDASRETTEAKQTAERTEAREEGPPAPAATGAHGVWAERVTARLPEVLDALVGEAVGGKLPAIQLILKCEGLMDTSAGDEPDEDQYPVIVGVCCERAE